MHNKLTSCIGLTSLKENKNKTKKKRFGKTFDNNVEILFKNFNTRMS